MQKDELIILGQANYRNQRKKFGIKRADRRRHVYVSGKTSMGKSTLLLNCIIQDMQYGNGVAVIDPHGDMVQRVLDHIPSHRINETVYFNPADTEYPIAFNPLYHSDPSQKQLVASGIIQVFKKIWANSWGARLEYVLRNVLLALLERKGNTLLGVARMLSDDGFRERVIRSIKDPIVRNFWVYEYERYPKVFRTETISPIQNKVGQFLSSPVTRNILGQTRTKFDLSEVMDSGKILLVNLSKGQIGEDNSSLLGSLIVTQLYLAALRRADMSEGQRQDYFMYIDELHTIATNDFPAILSESRKYGLYVAGMANQYVSQLSPQLRSAIIGNVGTLMAFASGSEDAAILEPEFQPTFNALDLQSLPQFSMYLKLSINGRTSEPFSAETFPVLWNDLPSHRKKIIEQSRLRYSQRRTVVEQRYNKWLQH